jgi:SpoIID/LytB domain protein
MFNRLAPCACGLALALAVVVASPRLAGQRPTGIPAGAAYRVIDLATGRTVVSSRDDLLRTPVLPGSILKIATMVAALESGVIGPDSRLAASHDVVIAGHRLACSHPPVSRPIGPAEALSISCNGYFAAVAGRLRRESLDAALRQLGLPASSPAVSVQAAALGIEGTRIPAERLLAALVKVTGTRTVVPANVRGVVIEGLRGAAEFGTAAVFRERGLTALAKTGTAPMPGGGQEGLVVAVTPADGPTRGIVVMAPGAAGTDAARIAVDVLQATAQTRPAPGGRATPGIEASPGATLRVGRTRRGGGVDVVTMPLEEYVARVVSAEAAPSSGLEAHKALAIVARTFALRNRLRHKDEGFDVCDLTHCQVVGERTPGGDEAARGTAGLVLFHGSDLAQVFYHASCGGRTERGVDVWPAISDVPYLPSRSEPECASERWETEVPAHDLERALAAAGRKGSPIRRIVVEARSRSGRVTRLRFDGVMPPEMTGEEFRLAVGRTLGWQLIKSSLFDLRRTARGYRFDGRGRGHGVGLCVVGSARMAAAGRTAVDILARYFPGTRVAAESSARRAASPDLRLGVVLPVEQQRERPRIETIARASVRQFATSLGIAPPTQVTVVFHATVEAYSRATGQPWWTGGATAGSRIDMIPADVLRKRGTLEETLRHELAHVVTNERLVGRPIWVKEAIAMRLAAEGRIARLPATSDVHAHQPAACPSDAEWRAIRSAAGLASAYRAAAACLATQLAAGRSWDQVQ